MALLRLDAAKDPRSGLYFLAIFYPADAEQPFVTTEPCYKTADAAENDAIAILAAGANTRATPDR